VRQVADDDPLSFQLNLNDVMAAVIRTRPALVCFGNPSNPLGQSLDHVTLEALVMEIVKVSPGTAVFIDATFHSYGLAMGVGMPDYSRLIGRLPLLVVGSLSKEYGYAGVRAGYVAGSGTLIRSVRPFLIGTRSRIETIAQCLTEVGFLRDSFRELGSDLVTHVSAPAPTSFALINVAPQYSNLASRLTEAANIDLARVVRFDCTASMLLEGQRRDVSGHPIPNVLRVSAGTHEQNATLLYALARLRAIER
jgi:histidinol-phosphate/aromatic aminotransferase/cobyric acid decarboxylase-like protein